MAVACQRRGLLGFVLAGLRHLITSNLAETLPRICATSANLASKYWRNISHYSRKRMADFAPVNRGNLRQFSHCFLAEDPTEVGGTFHKTWRNGPPYFNDLTALSFLIYKKAHPDRSSYPCPAERATVSAGEGGGVGNSTCCKELPRPTHFASSRLSKPFACLGRWIPPS